ncbi:MAG: DUF748 domain-containing protein [Desulfobulbaceae bacterium]
MKRFGEIPINPDDQKGRSGDGRQESESPAEGVAPTTALPEPDVRGDLPEEVPEGEPVYAGETEPAPDAYRQPTSRRTGKKRKRPPGRRLPRLAAWLLLLPLTLFLLYVVGSYLFVPLYIKGALARTLSQRLDRPVAISRAVFSPFSLRLFLEDIAIGPVIGDQSEQPLLSCARIDCRITLARLSSGILICEDVLIRDLQMQINRDAAVSSDLADTWRLLIPSANKSKASLWPSWLLPGEITLTGGTVLVDDPAERKQHRIEQIELYLPPLDPQQALDERLPRLSAVINESPVQIEAVRDLGSGGRMETSFDLKVKSVVLANYLEELPVLDQRLRLVEGQADMELRLIFPQTGSGGQRVQLEGSSTVSAVKVVDQHGTNVFSVPSAQLDFHIAPLGQRYRFSKILLEDPQLHLTLKNDDAGKSGLTMSDLGSVLLSPVRLPLNLGVDLLQLTGGKVLVALPGKTQKEFAWNDVSFNLEHFTSPGVSLEEKKSGPAHFTFHAVDNAGKQAVTLAGEGDILPDGGVRGKAALDQFDFNRYQGLLPRTALNFTKGSGSLHFTYESKNDLPGKGETPGEDATFRVSEGDLAVTGYALNVQGKKAAAGKSFRCADLRLDGPSRKLTCTTLELSESEIFAPGFLLAALDTKPDGASWQLEMTNLRIKDGRLHAPLLRPLCSVDKSLLLADLDLDAKDLAAENAVNNISAQGRVGGKGSVTINGGYSRAKKQGNLQINLQHLDFALFDACLRESLVPAVKGGTINIQGNVSLPANEFAGQISVHDLLAGEENGPSVAWRLATSDRVRFQTDPLHLDLGEIMVRKPVIQPGLINSENLLRNFFHPGKPLFKNLAVSKISIDDGRFSPFWPVLLPGYQPELEGVNGSISDLGGKAMPFSFSGKVGGVGDFTVSGHAGMNRIEEYALALPTVTLTPFADFFLRNMGMSVESARGTWQQSMTRADNVAKISTEIGFQGLAPVVESPLLKISSLLLGNKGDLRMEIRDDLTEGSERPLLLSAVQQHLQRQKIRVDISEDLVLRELFPDLQLPNQISFAPGEAQPLVPEGLAGFKQLFGIRPYLGLRLHAVIDQETDREALRRMVQEEADLKREAENSRRALLKLQREEREKQRLAEMKAGKTPVVTEEEIAPDELAGDLEPLPYVQVEVTEGMLAELAIKRLHAVQGYLQRELAVDPARVQIAEGFNDGPPQVRLRLVPSMVGKSR